MAWIIVAALTPANAHAAAPLQVAPGVYVLLGDNGEINSANSDAVGNAGFIVGARGVAAVDTGVSYRDGERLIAAIAGTTSLPVEAAVITHPVQEFLFGAAAFQDHHVPVFAQRATATLMQRRCGTCLKNLTTLLGAEAMQGSLVVTPDHLVDASTTLDLGRRRLRLLHDSWAATPGDLAVFDEQSGVLFAGGLVDAERVPNLRDAQLDGWIAALEHLRRLPIRVVVPGHGPVGRRDELTAMIGYLKALDGAVRASYRSGASLIEAMASVRLPAYEHWSQYAVQQPQNVQYVYRRLEDAEFRK